MNIPEKSPLREKTFSSNQAREGALSRSNLVRYREGALCFAFSDPQVRQIN